MKIYVTPREGLNVKNPATNEDLPAEGMSVESSSYWTRRALARDVTVGEPKKGAK